MTERADALRATLGSIAQSLRKSSEQSGGCDPALAERIETAARAAVTRFAEAAPPPEPSKPAATPVAGEATASVADAGRQVATSRGPTDRGSKSGASAPVGELPWVPQKGSAPAKGVGSDALRAIRADLGDCERCGLCARRSNIVFGVGNPRARLMFVGEAPGADEDRQGEPFVGRAGQLLTKMIGAMGLSRADVYIANVVKCRPPGNRDPQPDEVANCRPFLDRQIAAIEPEAIVTLGRVAASTLLDRSVAITRERGSWTSYRDVPVLLTLHPAFLLRQPTAKKDAWADLQKVMQRLGLERPGRS